ncbi:MAG: RIP metalloprotease RseP [Alphaproteobacteria bacterium]
MDIIVDYALPFLIVLTILVFVHELGHYWVARRNNVRVDVFSIGFGPELFGFNDSHGTRWKFSAIPLGGYVKMFGEGETVEEEEKQRDLTPEEKQVSFHHKRVGQRAAIVAAGPIANFLFAFVVLAGLYAATGVPAPLAGIGTVQPGSAAAKADLRPGDRVIEIAGVPVKWFEEMRTIIMANPATTVPLVLIRDDTEISVKVTPTLKTVAGDGGTTREIGLLGVTPNADMIEYESVGMFRSVVMGAERTYGLTMMILTNVGEIIGGSRSSKELGGIMKIADFSGQMVQRGWVDTIFFLALLSINLGLINFFPIPMLDGGHLVFYAAEAVLGRPIGARVQEYSFRFGLILILILMVYVNWNDVVSYGILEFNN